MKENKIVCWCARVSGILLMLATLPHYFLGLPEAVLRPIADGRITDPEVGNNFYVIWVFSSITMFLTGATLLFISTDLRYLQRRSWKLALLIGIGITGFGLSTSVKFPEAAAHMSLFTLIGIITLIPVLIFFRSYMGRDAT
ncbi:MAG TPA: hypothetical protein VGO50_19150 [Pyrinomonadaceae bacterium]|jgi:hypothetical protein|nr:hypothetical protein [Pyrinomonadaceae bacterium]